MHKCNFKFKFCDIITHVKKIHRVGYLMIGIQNYMENNDENIVIYFLTSIVMFITKILN
jgi:hypothetical protein